jgi:hypothetical protein
VTAVNCFGLAWSPDGRQSHFRKARSSRLPTAIEKTRVFDLQWSNDGRTLSFTQVENARQLDLSRPVRVLITLGVRLPAP